MKLRGEFVVRQIMDNTVVVPVGKTAQDFQGMILLNDVSKVIWECLEQETDMDGITNAVLNGFEVSGEQAREDILEFLDKLRQLQLLDE